MKVIAGFILICPLIISMVFLLKSLFGKNHEKPSHIYFESPFKSKVLTKITLKALTIIGFIIASYLVIFISIRFFFTSIEILFPWNAIGMILACLYLGIFGALYGLGETGHGGVSPSNVLRGFLSMVSETERSNEKLKKHNNSAQ